MENKYMGAIPNREITSVGCGQEARKLLQEYKIIMYEIKVIECRSNEDLKKIIFEKGSLELKNFIVMNISLENHHDMIGIRLKEIVKDYEDGEERFRMIEEVTKKLTKEIYTEEIERGNGHKSNICYNRCREERNKQECEKIYQEDSSSSDGKYYRNTWAGKRQKKQIEVRPGSLWKRTGIVKDIKKRSYETTTFKGLTLEDVKKKFKNVIDENKGKIKYCKIEKCKIKTEAGEKVVRKGQMIPQAHKNELMKHLEDLEKRNVIKRSTSEWRNPIKPIVKPDGSIRLVSNLMALNDLVEKDPYELCNIRDIISFTQGSKITSVIDLKEAFYGVEIEEADKHKTAFEFDKKVYEWNSVVMGLKNSPQIMQRIMIKIFEKYLGRGIEVYMDDIVIHAKTREEHDKLFLEAMRLLEENNMRLNSKKIQYRQSEVKLLGVTLNGQDMMPSEIKKNEALEFPKPQNVTDVRRFLGLSGWFRGFIKNYAEKTMHMTDCLRGKNKSWNWTEELDIEFENMKKKEFLSRTDASNIGMGAVLMQKNEKEERVPVQWASKKFTPTETRYGISEKEMYAVYWGIKKFEYELRGRKFKVETDHKALAEIRRKPCFNNNRINRWIEMIQEFDFEIEYRQPDQMVVADALSRIHEVIEPKREMIRQRTEKQIAGKWLKHVEKVGDKEYWNFDSGRRAEIPAVGDRLELMKRYHEEQAPRGLGSVYYAMKFDYYWPGIKENIKMMIKKCEKCQKYNRKKSGGCDFIATSRYLEKVAIDLIDYRDLGKFVLVVMIS
ncbi:reverse transcriptase [Vairimorpha necatrix]|uniref:Reverse transcriptase n=1 Tax=Vairimorpha necatrix TaxID=6039 RepID=A0AAX4JBM5_9MICR